MWTDRTVTELESHLAWAARDTGRAGTAAPTTLLHIGGEHVLVLVGRGEKPDAVHRLELGAQRIARTFLRHDPPASRELELAIDAVEDEVMRLPKSGDPKAGLISTDDGLREWAADSGATMTIETVEQWFQRLASTSLGHPGAMQGLPRGGEAAATLLILREFMHHLGYASITVVDVPPGTPTN